ncbi:MAG: hypothetical protein KAR06_10315 [Deltaproteobacteria bacterium]|nr:hypothetical protein [Deltaproteobacteria bacterium]
MARNKKHPGIIKKFLYLMVLFCAFPTIITWYSIHQNKVFGAYDLLLQKLSELKISVIELEFVLDIHVVEKRYLTNDNAIVLQSVDALDSSMKELYLPRYAKVINRNDLAINMVAKVIDNWGDVREKTLNVVDITTEEEAHLIHYTVDTKAYALNEFLNKLILEVKGERNSSLKDRRDVLLFLLVIFLIIILTTGGFFYYGELTSIKKLCSRLDVCEKDGEKSLDVAELRGSAKGLADGVSVLLSDAYEAKEQAEKSYFDTMIGYQYLAGKIEVLYKLSSTAGKSLSPFEVFMSAAQGAIEYTKACAAAIYILEGEEYVLKVSKGFSGQFFHSAEVMKEIGFEGDKVVMGVPDSLVFSNLDGFPDERMMGTLRAEAVTEVALTPVIQGDVVIGVLLTAYKDDNFELDDEIYFRALAANIGVAVGYSRLFYGEHEQKRFFEKILSQFAMPIAAFNKDGLCIYSNKLMNSIIGLGSDAALMDSYNILMDEAFKAGEGLGVLKAAFKGIVGSYEAKLPYLVDAANPEGDARINVQPIFDDNGNMVCIVVLVEAQVS